MNEVATEAPLGPPPEIIYKHRLSLLRSVRDIGRSWELVRALAERQLRGRYKQAILGFAWALITPIALMIVFTLLLSKIGNVHTHGVPYPLFSYMGLLPWTFFASSVQGGANSIISNISLINKIYCPREVFPLSSVVVAAIDTFLSIIVFMILFVIYGFAPYGATLWAPVMALVLVAFTIGWALIMSVLVVWVRDLRYGLPLLLQIGILVTPVAYGFDVIPERWRGIYSFLNPIGPVIDGFRRTILYGQRPQLNYLGIGALGAATLLGFGFWMFKRMEAGIADVA